MVELFPGLPSERDAGLEEAATIALEQRCERNTPWDLACVAVAQAIRARITAGSKEEK